jgi:Tfp pilus assembly protein PilF
VAVIALGQTADPSYAPLQRAYDALRARDYDMAIAAFEQAISLAPDRTATRKDLAYTLLKVGETESARDQFAAAMRLDPKDEHVALEYAFLCNETRQPAEARRVFDRIRKNGNATAAQAFENIDRPLREGIARWTRVVAVSPDNVSAHEELARLAEQRDEPALAAEHYEKAWRLRPDRRELLLDLGRALKADHRDAEADAALLAASRGGEPRVAEEAQELLPRRYPYASEFQKALDLDPSNSELRRELAYLELETGNRGEAEKQFQTVIAKAPNDVLSAAQLGFLRLAAGDSAGAMPLLQKAMAEGDPQLAGRVRSALHLTPASDAKQLAARSMEKGYMKDALKYLHAAHEDDPVDFDVMLKLGWAYNILKNDEEAVRWFKLARRSPDRTTAAEASTAYRNLEAGLRRIRTTVWLSPMFSTRWHDLFAYAQAKTELRLPHWPVHPYVSVRFIGDSRGSVFLPNVGFQYLSERSAIVGLGLATTPWRGMTAWVEAGESLNFVGGATPDYRGGLSYAKGFGNLLASGKHGLFTETNDDAVFVSRFANDTLFYSQNRTGYTFRETEGGGAFHAQFYWNWNITADVLRQYWANYVETGPGVRFRFEGMPAAMTFSINALHGVYLVNQGNPRRPNFNDLRIGIWYAFTH